MAGFFRRLPFFVVLLLVAGAAMQVPALYAVTNEDFFVARTFFYAGLMVAGGAVLIGFTQQGGRRWESERGYLVSLLLAYLWLPFVLSFPMAETVADTRFINVYFDMVSALTTTGAPVFDPDRLAPAVHLWRGLVGWMGGLLIWVTAVAVLAPLNLGGYEVTSEAQVSGSVVSGVAQMNAPTPVARLRKHARRLIPVYVGLTALLALALAAVGEDPSVAVIHAMSKLATSGITPTSGLVGSPAGVAGEMLIFLFLIFAVSRRSFTSGIGSEVFARLARDRELRLAIFAVVVIPTLLFVRHWVGAFEVDELGDAGAALGAFWGSIFTVLSFLTTTGFVSDDWALARSWSGLPTPGILLIGLVLMGGGVATTAGGLKLLRVYALYKHGTREIGRLIHPHSVGGAGRLGRRIRREGAYIAWVFFMLFILSLAAVMLLLALSGLDFEEAMIFAISALTTTGPLATVAGESPLTYIALTDAAKIILAGAMILGRMETLVLIALFNPGFWRA